MHLSQKQQMSISLSFELLVALDISLYNLCVTEGCDAAVRVAVVILYL
jgi:hypothetical protein